MTDDVHTDALVKAENLADEGRFEECLEVCDDVLQEAPQHAAALNIKGLCLNDLGRKDEAIDAFRAARSALPIYAPIRYNLARVLDDTEDIPGALTEYDEALKLDEDHLGARMGRGSIRMRTGDLDGAMSDFEEAVVRNPDTAECYAARGACRLYRKDLEEAQKDFLHAVLLDPGIQSRIIGFIQGVRKSAGPRTPST